MKFVDIKAVLFSIFMLCITYFAWHNSATDEINVPLILIILSLSYIIFSKFYLILKFVKEQNINNTIFVFIMFIVLFIPICKMNNELMSDTEERYLADFPTLTINGKINSHFGIDFEKWFNDRFFGRNQLISIFNTTKVYLSGNLVKFPTVHFYKSNGWMFANQNVHGYKTYSPKQLKKLSTNIKTLNEFCKKNNIKLYIMVVPSKEMVYKDYDLMRLKKTNKNKVKTAINYLEKDINFTILYPEKELNNLKKENKIVYFKTDTHPTDDAAFELYKLFINKASNDFKDLQITKESEFTTNKNNLVRSGNDANVFEEGTYYRLAYINYPKLLATKYTYYNYKHIDDIKNEIDFLHQTYTNTKGKYKLFILGDSFQENMSRFLYTNFYKIDKWRANFKEMFPIRNSNLDMEVFGPIILDFKPNILLIILYQDNTDWLLDLYPTTRCK